MVITYEVQISGYSDLRNLVKKQLVQGLSNLDFENKFCEECVIRN
jgi:hypothetical protein